MQLYRRIKCIDENFILKQKINVICLRCLHHLRRCLLRHSCYCSQRSSSRSGRVREDENNKIVVKHSRENRINRIQAYKQIYNSNNKNGNKTKKSTLMLCCCRHHHYVYRLLRAAVLKRRITTTIAGIIKTKKNCFCTV